MKTKKNDKQTFTKKFIFGFVADRKAVLILSISDTLCHNKPQNIKCYMLKIIIRNDFIIMVYQYNNQWMVS